MENDSRYPYTYAADFVRGLAGYGEGGTKLSRSDASHVRQGIAAALGMDDAELARKLADHYKTYEFRGAPAFGASLATTDYTPP